MLLSVKLMLNQIYENKLVFDLIIFQFTISFIIFFSDGFNLRRRSISTYSKKKSILRPPPVLIGMGDPSLPFDVYVLIEWRLMYIFF
jgi:hypothetical protein